MAMTVQNLVTSQQARSNLRWLAGQSGGDRPLHGTGVHAVDQIGYLNLMHAERIAVLGLRELDYYRKLDRHRRDRLHQTLLAARPPALIISDGQEAPSALVDFCNRNHLPLLGCRLAAGPLIETLEQALAHKDHTSMHGVLMDVLGMGVLITGDSGLGKSELALELISRGHGLVADDVVDIERVSQHAIVGRCPALLQGLLEVRGLGLIDIRTIFGESAVRRRMPIKLIVHLVGRRTMEDSYGRPQHRRAHRDRRAHHGAAAARHRHHARIRPAPAGPDPRPERNAPSPVQPRTGRLGARRERLLAAHRPDGHPPGRPQPRRCRLSRLGPRELHAHDDAQRHRRGIPPVPCRDAVVHAPCHRPGHGPAGSGRPRHDRYALPFAYPAFYPTMQLIIVTGISGSGKSLAIHVLEDAGYFCIDNLPVRYVLEVALSLEQEGHAKVAMSIDVRVGTRLTGLRDAVRQLRAQGHDVKVLFLNARTDSLVQRYSETRRRHPLTLPGRSNNTSHGADPKLAPTLEESIERERELMAEIEDIGTSIDTSDLHPNTLRQWVRDLVRTDRASMTLLFESFAFKQGVPLDADLVFDVRCLPNPYYDVELRTLTGLDQPVKDFLVDLPPVQKMIGDITRFITEWLPSYVQDNRHYLTIAIGCTGGQHRSVYVAQTLAEHFARTERVLVRHRALDSRPNGTGVTVTQTR